MSAVNRRWHVGHRWCAWALLIQIAALTIAAPAWAQTKNFNIPAQDATTGIPEFARQADIQILVSEAIVRGKRTAPVQGSYTINDGLALLLAGTDLVVASNDGNTITLRAGPGKQSAAEPANEGNILEEIVVTAQRREEKLQNVPISVSAFNAQALDNANVTGVEDIGKLDPSVTVGIATNVVKPYIRGVGNPSSTQGNEASGAIYVDGIYYARLPAGLLNFNNIERVEVEKGPQGTLFGRNSEAGLIQIITRDPTEEPTLRADVGYGNYDTFRGNFYAATGFGEKVAGDLAVYFVNQGSGWGKDVTTGHDTGFEDDFSARSKWVFRPADDTEIKLALDYNYTKSTDGLAEPPYQGTVAGTFEKPFQILPTLSFYDVAGNIDNVIKELDWGASVRLTQNFDFADFISLTAFRRTDLSALQDGDASPQNYLVLHYDLPSQQTSQEFQLISTKGSAFDWIVGLFYLNDYAENWPLQEAGNALGKNVVDVFGRQHVSSYAGYTQETFHVLDHTDLTLGARYTIDDVTAYGHTDTQTPSIYVGGKPVTESKDFEKATFRVAVDQHFTDDIMGYISFSRGYKAGIFNITALTSPPVQPEVLDAYEIGAKAELFDHRLRVNGALFFYQIEHPQVQVVVTSSTGAATSAYINGQSASVHGLEINSELAVTDQLSARLGATVLDARYGSFPNALFYAANPNPPYGNGAAFAGNATNKYLGRAPNFSLNVGGDYRIATSSGTWEFNANYAYTGKFYWNPDNAQAQPAYGLLDASLSYMLPKNDHWRMKLWGKNLTGAEYYLNENETAGPAGDTSAVAPPRTFGFTVQYRY